MNLNELFLNSVYLGVTISLISYEIGVLLKKKFKSALFNPLLIAIILVIGFLLIFKIDYESYQASAKYLSYLLTPATVSLAIPLYEQIEELKANFKAIMIAIFSGVLTSLISIFLLAKLFNLSHQEYVTLLPKSITTAIGLGVVEELGGYSTITVAVIILTGVFGNLVASSVCRIFKINSPVSRGIAIGTSAHAIGTARAIELGKVEGAMSGLAIVITGLMTVIAANIFATLI